MNIVVLGGGDSTEREISLKSAQSVAKAVEQSGYEVTLIDPNQGFQILDNLPARTIVLPILHGTEGEDGVIQSELEKRNLPYLGTQSQESKVCFDKWLTLEKLRSANIPVAKGDLVDISSYRDHELAKGPHVLKVARGGSSIGTYIIRNPDDIDFKTAESVFSLDDKVIVEELVEGIEITVPVLDGEALPVIEIRPPENKEFDFENKYNGSTEEICPPQSIDESLQVKTKQLAKEVHQVLGARHLSRIDMIVRPNGEIIVLELNTMPGMTDQSLYPKSAAAAGMSMTDLVKKFINLVIRDYNIKDNE